MEMLVTLGLDISKGTLKLSTIECNCHIADITIDLDGGASWLYQGYVNILNLSIFIGLTNLSEVNW